MTKCLTLEPNRTKKLIRLERDLEREVSDPIESVKMMRWDKEVWIVSGAETDLVWTLKREWMMRVM